jgi:large subunit ribosomal protein L29
MKARDLRDRSTEDLAELERSLTGERFQNKFKNFTNRLDDTSVIRKQKRDLARVKLILTERSRGITVIGKPRDEAAVKPKPRAPKPVEATAVVATSAEGTGETLEAAPKGTKAKAAVAKTGKAETKPAAEKKSKAPAAAKPTAKKPKAKEETK